MIQNKNDENPSQKLILLSGNMFDYIVRLLVWAVDGSLRQRNTLEKKKDIGIEKTPIKNTERDIQGVAVP